ncbi:MAG: hypothetical protein A2340_00425 [Lentisphaerae bacterium RIFOXYB12_FULL_60_10]|nr:MAG: hypothetical protein A2340_00425 [Lentisphaerae bacterium RIFOXYB12_FULL_60_10]
MKAFESLVEYINGLTIIDTHEHLPVESKRDVKLDVLAEWLIHYFSCDLVSAGLPDADLATLRDPKQDLAKRWKLVEPYWRAAESTGYGRSLAISARDLYGVDRIDASSIQRLNAAFVESRDRGGHYGRVLQEKSKIALSIRDSFPFEAELEAPERFVYTFKISSLIWLAHHTAVRSWAEKVGKKVHTFADWLEVVEALLDRCIPPGGRVVALKIGEAYTRSLFFDKVTYTVAEAEFNQLYHTDHSPDWRVGVETGRAYQDYLMHFICRYADRRGLPMQIHTGIQEGNGNYVPDTNPTLLTNLFLEYRDVKFDLFHMSYPYCMEAGNLAKNFRNVNLDMCWGHIISPEAARRALVEWLDAVPANKISAFGGDYVFVDGVYGHQVLARRNVAASLAQKVDDGTFDLDRAKEIAHWMFWDNPVRIFGLETHLKG